MVSFRGAYWDHYCLISSSVTDSRIECTLGKFVDGSPSTSLSTKLSGAVNTLERWDTIQRDLDKLKKWTHVLHLGQGNP